MVPALIESVEALLDLLDNHDVIKKSYQVAYAIRREQLVLALEQVKRVTYWWVRELTAEDIPAIRKRRSVDND